tara:strand:+ start:44230 stop:45258 length:1029 start_codon:yes stop_codon:yes gene_type:complete
MSDKIPVIKINGPPFERGRLYGFRALARIQATYEFYDKHLFTTSPLTQAQIRERSYRVADLIDTFDTSYTEEIHGIANGASLEPWQIYSLNARTEILNAQVAECTSLYFQDGALLGQTWDWVRELESLMVLLEVEYPDGRRVLTLTEPGMLAKIGFNNKGLGVCLNILLAPHSLTGVPVHVLLRAIMECEDMEAARDVIRNAGNARSSHFMVGDGSGSCIGMEFAGGRSQELQPQDGVLLHTNHCLAPNLKGAILPSSQERYQRAMECLKNGGERDRSALLAILSDQSQGDLSILCPYHSEALMGNLQVGTCATVVMDLAEQAMYLRRGPHAGAIVERYRLD